MTPFLGILLDDPYDAVRAIAARSLRTLPGRHAFAFDPVQSPNARPKLAERLARAASGSSWPASIPLQSDGSPRKDVVDRLLSRRDQRPIDLLE